MPKRFVGVPSIYPKLLEIRQSKTAEFKNNKYLRDTTKLRYYQVIGSLHMMLLERMVLGDGTGLGKTLQGIAAYSFLMDKDPSLKCLIVCPKSATYQWQEEFEKFTQGITTRVLTNKYNGLMNYDARKQQYKDFKENVLITGYAPLKKEYDVIQQILAPRYMIIYDEAVEFKNKKTQAHFSCKYLAESAERVYGFSATIIKNSLEEVWGIYDVIVPGLFGNITNFRNTYCQQKLIKIRAKNGKERRIPKIIGYKNLKKFKDTLSPYFLIRKKEEVADELPKLISKKITTEMYPEQKELYRQALAGIMYEERVKSEYFEVMDAIRNGSDDEKTLKKYEGLKEKYEQSLSSEGKKRSKLAAITYCQMISNGPGLLNEAGESSKEDEFMRLMTDELVGEKVIMFTRFKRGIPFLEIRCERNGINYVKITGDESDRERKEARIRFQEDPNCNLVFITTAGSASLNLQAAGYLIFYDTPWSYGDLVQTIGRAQRIGSLHDHVVIIHIVNKGTIDEKVIKKVSGKKELSDEVVGDIAEGALDFTNKDGDVIDDLYEDLLKDAGDIDG